MRLIDADALEKAISVSHSMTDDYGVQTGYAISMRLIEDAPTIDPVRKGHWDKVDETPYIRKHFNVVCCSVCRKKGYTAWNYCPNCGAKMEEPEDIPMEYFESGGR